jgi:hypothetical protein
VTVGTDRSNTGGGQDRQDATGQEVELQVGLKFMF